jgi:hypothetical protein
MHLFPLSTTNCPGDALLHIRITFFDLAPSFDLQSLSLRTPPASAGVIILSMLVSNLKYRTVYRAYQRLVSGSAYLAAALATTELPAFPVSEVQVAADDTLVKFGA